MLVFPSMLVNAAEKAGMKVPEDPDNFDSEEFPHFRVFCLVQLNRPMLNLAEHWENAEIVAKVPDDKIMTVCLDDLIDSGLSYST